MKNWLLDNWKWMLPLILEIFHIIYEIFAHKQISIKKSQNVNVVVAEKKELDALAAAYAEAKKNIEAKYKKMEEK